MKRALDLFLVILLAPAVLFVCACATLAIFLDLGRPIIYVSERAGKGGKPFRFYKFRTMREGEGSDGERLTKLGKILRKLSIDELPQLYHVLIGEMSLVGPRPLPTIYLPRYSLAQMRRHEVLPGITGWAQVNGRNALDWPTKFKLDVWYVDHQSFALDVKILLLTIKKVVTFSCINHPKYDTMVEFRGET